MLESGSSGSVRGVLSNEHPYREPGPIADSQSPENDMGTFDFCLLELLNGPACRYFL